MTLNNCVECNSEIPSKTSKCPKCGHLHKNVVGESGQTSSKLGIVLSMILGLGCLIAWFGFGIYFILPYDTAILGAVLVLLVIVEVAVRQNK